MDLCATSWHLRFESATQEEVREDFPKFVDAPVCSKSTPIKSSANTSWLNNELPSGVRHPNCFVINVLGDSNIEISDLPLDVLIRLFLQDAPILDAIHQ
ncbi:hypothetical protein HAX54_024234 [Datura stramonium]|uniref:Uncharacterized protein n=1 Tax=Datura stramonium TaxID=4076 RepID=A0ABS8UYB8_DATST|nr:hypothetical protein [Datura stramonium]